MGHKAHGLNLKSNIHGRLVDNPPATIPRVGIWVRPAPIPCLRRCVRGLLPTTPTPCLRIWVRGPLPRSCVWCPRALSLSPRGDVGERGSGESGARGEAGPISSDTGSEESTNAYPQEHERGVGRCPRTHFVRPGVGWEGSALTHIIRHRVGGEGWRGTRIQILSPGIGGSSIPCPQARDQGYWVLDSISSGVGDFEAVS